MENNVVIGVDPGLDGSVALVWPSGATVWDIPTIKDGGKRAVDAVSLAAELRHICKHNNPIAIIEKVHAMPGQGVSSMFSFGRSFGVCLGVIAALEVPHTFVSPAVWKKAVGLQRGATKEDSRAMALRLFPTLAGHLKRKKDHGRAEALLIAEYAMRSHYGLELERFWSTERE